MIKTQKEAALADATVKRFEANVAQRLATLEGPNGLSGTELVAFSRLENVLSGAAEAKARALEADNSAKLREAQAEDARRNWIWLKEGVRTNLPGGYLGFGLGVTEYANSFIGALMEQFKRATPSWSKGLRK